MVAASRIHPGILTVPTTEPGTHLAAGSPVEADRGKFGDRWHQGKPRFRPRIANSPETCLVLGRQPPHGSQPGMNGRHRVTTAPKGSAANHRRLHGGQSRATDYRSAHVPRPTGQARGLAPCLTPTYTLPSRRAMMQEQIKRCAQGCKLVDSRKPENPTSSTFLGIHHKMDRLLLVKEPAV